MMMRYHQEQLAGPVDTVVPCSAIGLEMLVVWAASKSCAELFQP